MSTGNGPVVDAVAYLKGLLEASPSLPEASDASASGRPTHLESNSIFGLFVRRTLLSCDIGDFASISRLYEHLQSYVESFQAEESKPVHTPAIHAELGSSQCRKECERNACGANASVRDPLCNHRATRP